MCLVYIFYPSSVVSYYLFIYNCSWLLVLVQLYLYGNGPLYGLLLPFLFELLRQNNGLGEERIGYHAIALNAKEIVTLGCKKKIISYLLNHT